MATTTTKGRSGGTISLSRSRSPSRRPKAEHNGSDPKSIKPLPNYLKPTISSRPEPVKHLKKGHNALDDHQKLLRRRSFDRPSPSLSSPSTSSRLQKSLNISPARPQERASDPRDKNVTALRSSSFHGSKSFPRGGGAVKSPPLGPKNSHGTKKSSLSTTIKKEGSSTNVSKKLSDKEIIRESSPPMPVHEEQEIVKVETDVQVSDDREEAKSEDKEVQAEVVQSNELVEEEKEGDQTNAYPVIDCADVVKEEVINEDKTVEQIEEANSLKEDSLNNKGEGEEEVETEVDEESSAIATDENETTGIKESAEDEKEHETSNIKERTSETKVVVAESTKRQVVQGKKESPSAYNDVIEKTASKLLENRKNKVKALVGAFETVIDYETAASK